MEDAKLDFLAYQPKDYMEERLEFSPLQRAMQEESIIPTPPSGHPASPCKLIIYVSHSLFVRLLYRDFSRILPIAYHTSG